MRVRKGYEEGELHCLIDRLEYRKMNASNGSAQVGVGLPDYIKRSPVHLPEMVE